MTKAVPPVFFIMNVEGAIINRSIDYYGGDACNDGVRNSSEVSIDASQRYIIKRSRETKSRS